MHYGLKKILYVNLFGGVKALPALTDGNYGKPNSYGALLLDKSHYSYFTLFENVNISFSSNIYRDSGGSSGQKINFYRLENGKYNLYHTLQQINNKQKYGTHYFTKGTYKLGPPATNYVEFDEWDFEIVK